MCGIPSILKKDKELILSGIHFLTILLCVFALTGHVVLFRMVLLLCMGQHYMDIRSWQRFF